MASKFIRRDRAKKFCVKYLDPIKAQITPNNPWKYEYFYTQQEQKVSYARWTTIQNRYLSNDPTWKDLYDLGGYKLTLYELFEKYKKNKFKYLTNKHTRKRYQNVMNSIMSVFGKNQVVSEIPTKEKDDLIGWEIYKQTRSEQGCTDLGIDSYMRDGAIFFRWAKRGDLITKEIIIRDDFADPEKLPPRKWTDEEIEILKSHPALTEYEKDLVFIYVYTGCRANHLLSINREVPEQILLWQHVNFQERTILIPPQKKKSSQRELIRLHEAGWHILKKWKDQGNEAPIPLDYQCLRRRMVRIAKKTGIDFTCHDLRRLHTQLAERAFHSMHAAQLSVGHTSMATTQNSYARPSIETMDYLNDGIVKQFHTTKRETQD